MLQAYIDDSVADGKVLILGGLIASVELWEVFSVAWQERLDHAGWKVFKMAKAWSHRANEDKWEHTKWHYFTIRDHVQGAVCITVPLVPLAESARKFRLLDTPFANPYTWAFIGIIRGLVSNQQSWGLDEPVDFIFDERGEEDQVRHGWEAFAAKAPEHWQPLIGRKPIFENDERVLPLQAADMWAWWCRKQWIDNGGRMSADTYPIPWGKPGEIGHMVLQWSAEKLEEQLSRTASLLDDAEPKDDG